MLPSYLIVKEAVPMDDDRTTIQPSIERAWHVRFGKIFHLMSPADVRAGIGLLLFN